jgi:anti-anti-sigma factor
VPDLRIDAHSTIAKRIRSRRGRGRSRQIRFFQPARRHVRPLRRAGALSFGILIMPIEKWSDRIVIAHLSADPHLGEDLQTVQDQLGEAGENELVLDFSAVKYLNSSHIARLLKIRKARSTAGSRMVLCAVDTQVWGAFLVTGLDKIFEFTDSVPTALAALQINPRA